MPIGGLAAIVGPARQRGQLRRQLGRLRFPRFSMPADNDLVDARRQLARREVVASTPMARPRPHLRPLRHLLGRQQDSLVTLVTGLPTALAARCLFRRPRSRRIARRRLVRIGRVLPELTLQLCDSTLQARDLGVPSRKDLQQVSHLGLQPADALVRRRHTANRSCRDPPVDPPRHMITYGHQVADPVNGYQGTTIRFGRDANQIYHSFRHVDEMGLARAEVQSAIERHLLTVIDQIASGRPLNQVIEVAGQRVQYTAFRLPDGTINVGRIHGVP